MNFLFQKQDVKQLAILRILIGSWFFVDCVSMMIGGWMQDAYIHSQLNFPYYGFEWISRLPGWGMYTIFIVMSFAGLGVATGYRYRLSLGIFFTLFLYVFMLDIVYDLNKFYLFLILGFLLFFVDAHRYWSLDVKYERVAQSRFAPRWQLFIFQFLFAMVYFYSGLAKINPDWLFHGEPLRTFHRDRAFMTTFGPEVYSTIVMTLSYCGLFFDLTIGLWLVWRKSNPIANTIQATFHTMNLFLLGVGSLSIYMIFFTWLLFPTQWLIRKLKVTSFDKEVIPMAPSKRKWVIGLIAVFFIIQLTIPHRHYLTGNNVNWTEKGHRFSWRLMTRTKSGSSSYFYVIDRKTKEKWKVNPREYLTGRQYRKMSAETDLVIVFARYLEQEWKEKGYDDVIINGVINTKLNGRVKQYLIDPKLDLTTVSRSLLRDDISSSLNPRD